MELSRQQLVRRLVLGLPALALMSAVACPEPAEPIVLRTESERFSVRLTGIERTEQVNRLHGFDLVLTTIDGQPAAGASIILTGERRYAPNPFPTLPQVRRGPADGTYRVEGLRFHMAGEWRLVFAIEFEKIRDRVTFDVVVK